MQEWNEFVSEFSDRKISFPRYIESSSNDFEIHAFADASQFAYATCIYIRGIASRKTTLIFAKARIKPLKSLTIPRMELMAALVAARGLTYVARSILSINSRSIQPTRSILKSTNSINSQIKFQKLFCGLIAVAYSIGLKTKPNF